MRLRRWVWASALSVPVLILTLWVTLYPGAYDPKNIRYVCWKSGLCSLDPDRALSVMLHDNHASRIVTGKTKQQLAAEFGYRTPVGSSSPYLQYCYEHSWLRGRDVQLLRKSDWVVVFENSVASKLVLVKGC